MTVGFLDVVVRETIPWNPEWAPCFHPMMSAISELRIESDHEETGTYMHMRLKPEILEVWDTDVWCALTSPETVLERRRNVDILPRKG